MDEWAVDLRAVRKHVFMLCRTGNLDEMSVKSVRLDVEQILGRSLDEYKKEVKAFVDEAIGEKKKPAAVPAQKKPAAARAQKKKKERDSSEEETRLRAVFKRCGIAHKARVRGVKSPDEVVDHLTRVLVAVLGTSRPKRAQVAAFRKRAQIAADMDGIRAENVLTSARRVSRTV